MDDQTGRVLLTSLWDMINKLKIPTGDSLLEKYNYFSLHSEKKENCTYALKCLSLFKEQELELVKQSIFAIVQCIRETYPGYCR